jgi:Right handed beta helix region
MIQKSILYLAIITVAVVWIPFCCAATIRVPEDYPVIQQAIDSAVDGDQISVAAGIYTGVGNTGLILEGKSLHLHARIPHQVIIDCGGSGYALQSRHFTGTDRSTVLEGFRIMNADSEVGALKIDTRLKVINCIFENNHSSQPGGALSGHGSPWIAACLFIGNRSDSYGGACAFISGAPLIDRCTFAGNQTDGQGNAISGDTCKIVIVNSIIWDETPIWAESTEVICNFSDIRGGVPDNWDHTGCIDLDPLFTDPGASDYTLQTGSPCRNAGDPLSRFNLDGSKADMGYGAYGGDLPGGVAGGPISGSLHPSTLDFIAVEDLVITQEDNLTIFPGTTLKFRNGAGMLIHGNLTVLSEPDNPCVTFQPQHEAQWFGGIRSIRTGSMNMKKLFITSAAGHLGGGIHIYGGTQLLWDVEVTNCWAGLYGGGMLIEQAEPSLIEVAAHHNTVRSHESFGGRGGGIAFTHSAGIMFRCHVFENSADIFGGGVYADYYSSLSCSNSHINRNICHGSEAGMSSHHLEMWECRFTENHAAQSGGGLWFLDGIVAGSTFESNTAGEAGGGLLVDHGQAVLCSILDNTAEKGGGGYIFNNTYGEFHSCTFHGNTASLGGAVYIEVDATPAFFNSILWENGDEIANLGDPVFEYSVVRNGSGQPWFGAGCLDTDPLFVQGPGGAVYLSHMATGQATDSPCIDANILDASDIQFEVGGLSVSLADFTTRIDGVTDSGIADMGYHYTVDIQPSPTYIPTPTPTPHAIFTTKPSPVPSPTPACDQPRITLLMPNHHFNPGDEFWLRSQFCHNSQNAISIDLYIVLDLNGTYFFYPSWSSQTDYRRLLVAPGWTDLDIIPTLVWPDRCGSFSNAAIWGLLVDPVTIEALSNPAILNFSWSE